MAIRVVSSKSSVPTAHYESLAEEYVSLREKAKAIKARMDVLSAQLKEHAESWGVPDETGSFYVKGKSLVWGKQSKKTITFDEDKALAFFKDNDMDDCITYVPSVNQEAVEARVSNGEITVEELENITNTKVSYAVSVTRLEDITQVEESRLGLSAASLKPKSPFRVKK